MTSLQALVLGLVQGLTEFLPVSSSGHLVLARKLLGLPAIESPTFEIVVHLGTLMSVLIVMFAEVWALVGAVPLLFKRSIWRQSFQESMAFRALVLLIPATIPTVIVGLFFKDQIDEAFGSSVLAASMLLLTAAVLFSTRWAVPDSKAPLSLKIAIVMGVAQAIAILPGISRSGSTIASGLLVGAERRTVGSFSFLMSIPAILGALILKFGDIADSDIAITSLLVGFIAATVIGSVSLWFLLKLVRQGQLWLFSPYLVLVALIWLMAQS